MADETLLRKLQVKHGRSLLVVNPPEGFLDRITPLPEGSEFRKAGPAEVVHLFVHGPDDIAEHAATAVSSVSEGGVLWVAYRKKDSKADADISRELGWEPLTGLGWRPVTQISIDQDWSALRFKPYTDARSGT